MDIRLWPVRSVRSIFCKKILKISHLGYVKNIISPAKQAKLEGEENISGEKKDGQKSQKKEERTVGTDITNKVSQDEGEIGGKRKESLSGKIGKRV